MNRLYLMCTRKKMNKMTNKERYIKAKELVNQLKIRGYKATIKDVVIVLKCRENAFKWVDNPWAEAHETKLYINNGVAYCVLLQILNDN